MFGGCFVDFVISSTLACVVLAVGGQLCGGQREQVFNSRAGYRNIHVGKQLRRCVPAGTWQ